MPPKHPKHPKHPKDTNNNYKLLFAEQNPVFIPGPTNIPSKIKAAMMMNTKDHRSVDVPQIITPIINDLKKIFKTKNAEIIIFPATGTAGWEAAVTNTLSPGDTVLVARYGMFCHRWIELCKRVGLNVEVIETPWGQGAPAEMFEEKLRRDKQGKIKAVLVTHNETSTGVKSDVQAVRKSIDNAKHDAMLFVDCVSSVGAMEFLMDQWNVDIAVAASQKAFMLPVGLAILAVSEKALKATKNAKLPRCFFEFNDMIKANYEAKFPYTPNMGMFFAMREAIDILFEEGIENVYQRHIRLAKGVRQAVAAWKMKLCPQKPELYSETVTAVCVPDGFDAESLIRHAYNSYGVSFGCGLGEVASKVFRISHMGAMNEAMLLLAIAVIEMSMKDLDYPIEIGSGVIAAQQYYRANNNNIITKK